MRWGRRTGAEQVPWWFVEAYYRAQASAHDVPAGAEEAHAHFLAVGRAAGLAPNPVHDVVGSIAPVDDDELGLLPVRPLVDVEGWLATHPSLKHRELARSVLEAARADPGLAVFRSPRGTRTSWQALLDRAASLADDAQVVRAAGAFDAELYSASTGVRFASVDAALWHYLEVGADRGLAPHAAFHPVLDGSTPDPRALARALRDTSAAVARPELGGGPLLDPGSVPGDGSALRRRVLETVSAVRLPAPERRSAAALLAAERSTTATSPRELVVVASASGLTGRSARAVQTLVRQDTDRWRLVILLDRGATPWRQGVATGLAAVDARIEVAVVDDADAWPHEVLERYPGRAVLVWDGSTHYRPDAFGRLLAEVDDDGAVRGWLAGEVATLTGLTVTAPASSTRALGAELPLLAASLLGPTLAARAPEARLDCAAWSLLLAAAERDALTVASVLVGRGARPCDPPPADADAVRLAAVPSPTALTADAETGFSLLVTSSADPAEAAEVARAAVAGGADQVVLACDATLPAVASLAALLADLPDVVVSPADGAGTGVRTARALRQARGQVVAVAPDALPAGSTWPRRCLAAVAGDVDVAVPVALTVAGTIRTAGLAVDRATGAAHPLLEGHPGDDAHLIDGLAVHGAASAGVVARREALRPTSQPARTAAVAASLAGARAVAVAEAVVDLEPPVDVPDALPPPSVPSPDPVDGLCDRAGWARAGVASRAGAGWRPVLVRPGAVTVDERRPRLRWALKNPAPGAPRGDRWGDTFFLDSLAAALRRLGQDVVIDRAEAHRRPGSDQLDDVTLTLRGLVPYVPTPGATHVLWVISHPDEVTDAELRSVDLAYGASRPWAEEATRRSGRPVHPLLQATDTTRFHPDVEPAPDVAADHVLFVGNHRGGGRPVVDDLLAVGAPLQVHGARWERSDAAAAVASTFVPNELLPRYYRAARLVANDHWPDMAARGFVSNRAFDAAAAGALVVSDAVAGGFPDLHGLVRAYTSREELADLVSGPGWMGRDERDEAARRVVDEHSFDARAATLLDDVAAHRARSR